jgi:PAS domain S-box-containing protein
MWIYDVHTLRILDVNDAAVVTYGYSREAFTRLTLLDIRPPEDGARVRRVVAATRDELSQTGPWQHRRKDGSLIDVEITSHPITFEGRPAKLVLALDVSDHLRAERELLASDQRYRLAARATSDMIYDWDVVADRIEWSEALRTVFGYGDEEIGHSMAWWSERLHADEREQVLAALERALTGDADHFAMRYRFRQAGGAYAIVLDRGMLLRDETGRAVRMVGAMTDVSDRERSVEELRRTYETLQALVQSSPQPIIAGDLDGIVTLWNPAAERVWGWSWSEAIGRPNPTIPATHAAEAVELRERVAQGEQIDGYETQRVRKDGAVVPVSLSMAPLYDARGRVSGAMSIVENVAEQRSLRDQLQQAQKMEAVGQLAGGIAHDFNNLLTAIISGAELALSGLDSRDPLREDLDQILKAGHRAAGLTRQLLAFSRRQVLKPAILDLNEVVADMERMLRRLIGENIHLETRLAGDLWLIRADQSQIEQVILNLAVNSRDAMSGGGMLTLETANVDLDAAFASRHVSVRPGPHVMLAVADTGEGMDAETRARVFEPFFTTKEPGKGTGLGLSTVYGIVKQSGGSIWVESAVGNGTRVTVYLPRAEGELRPVPSVAAAPPASGGRETLLLVEDDEQVRRVASEILGRNGYVVLQAANGGEALLICEQHPDPIHLMITDVVMPKMSGPQLANRLAGVRRRLKVLYLSGYTGGELAAQGVLEPGTEFMAKPFTPEALARRVREVLDR